MGLGNMSKEPMTKCLHPEVPLLCKLGSIVMHVDELFSDDSHAFDKIALEQLMKDPDVQEWILEMDGLSLIPKKRS